MIMLHEVALYTLCIGFFLGIVVGAGISALIFTK
jgi:hypothetical protein